MSNSKDPKVRAYFINEERGPGNTPRVVKSGNGIVRFIAEEIQRESTENRNGRSYPWDVLFEAHSMLHIKERLARGNWFCEIGHPTGDDLARQRKIDRRNASCILKQIDLHRPTIGGVFETCATQLGRDLMGLILENGIQVAFSMRALGRVREDKGCLVVQSPLYLVCYDDVIHPSVEGAYMTALTENAGSTKRSAEARAVLVEEANYADYIAETVSDVTETEESLGMEHPGRRIINGTVISEDGNMKIHHVLRSKAQAGLDSFLAK